MKMKMKMKIKMKTNVHSFYPSNLKVLYVTLPLYPFRNLMKLDDWFDCDSVENSVEVN